MTFSEREMPVGAADASPDEAGSLSGGARRSLLEEGWEERFSASGARLDEAVEHYRSLGFEVRTETLDDAAGPRSCTRCFVDPGADGPVSVIFTRAPRIAARVGLDDGLFEE